MTDEEKQALRELDEAVIKYVNTVDEELTTLHWVLTASASSFETVDNEQTAFINATAIGQRVYETAGLLEVAKRWLHSG